MHVFSVGEFSGYYILHASAVSSPSSVENDFAEQLRKPEQPEHSNVVSEDAVRSILRKGVDNFLTEAVSVDVTRL